MRVLLDTHALLWWLAGDRQLSKKAKAAIADEDNEVRVSAASAWEIATKYRLGRLPGAEVLALDFARQVERQGFEGLPITLDHAQRAGSITVAERDPFDRMLIAQAQAENLAFISIEQHFDDYGITRIW
jgi:PIN domain nuclease of toxin-antitoxin system